MRVRRNAEARLERSRDLAREKPEFADQNAGRLFLGSPMDRAFLTEQYIHEKFNSWIETAASEKMEGDPIIEVQVDSEQKFAFIEFRKSEMASACLSYLNNLVLDGWGKVKLERPKVYDQRFTIPPWRQVPIPAWRLSWM